MEDETAADKEKQQTLYRIHTVSPSALRNIVHQARFDVEWS
jgi:hypothetical protein